MANCIIEQILARPELTTKAFPPISTPDLARTEALIGFELPPLLRQLYLRVENVALVPILVGSSGV